MYVRIHMIVKFGHLSLKEKLTALGSEGSMSSATIQLGLYGPRGHRYVNHRAKGSHKTTQILAGHGLTQSCQRPRF